MRILQIRFENLNSLSGAWEIDLTSPAFTECGIFAITGPTGAGKSTLLDAMCLALYGRTPRLGRIHKSTNEIMSRHTGECFAEVTFETHKGVYRCNWSQRRAKRHPLGELQAPKHEIADARTGQIFETKLKGVAAQIEAATGMDFERFTRSMLLAQGGFAAFLQASADERAPILEQITGTEIYSLISVGVHERRGSERKKLTSLQTELALIQPMGDDEERMLSASLAEKSTVSAELERQIADSAACAAWLERTGRLEREAAVLLKAKEELQGRIEAFTPQAYRLGRAGCALELSGSYGALGAARCAQSEDMSALAECEENLPVATAEAGLLEERLSLAAAELDTKKAEQKQALPVIKKVRELDLGIRVKRTALADARAAIAVSERGIKSLTARLDDNTSRLQAAGVTLLELHVRTSVQKEEYSRLLSQLPSYLSARHGLIDGKPCPLCGSLDHPFANYGEKTLDAEAAPQNIFSPLEALHEEIEICQKKAMETELKIREYETDIRLCTEQTSESQESLRRQLAHGETLEAEHREALGERGAIFGEKDADLEEERISEAIESAERTHTDAAQQFSNAARGLGELKIKIGSLEKAVLARGIQIKADEESFFAQICSAGFANEDDYRAASMSDSERKLLAQRGQDLADERSRVWSKEQDKAREFEDERARMLTHKSAEQVKAELDTLHEAHKAVQQEIGGLGQRLYDNGRLRAQYEERMRAFEAQKSECATWEMLHELIGSGDGKKYRNFVQGLTFDMMIGHANAQLRKMSDRYTLVRNAAEPLELDVMDSYQAGEVRSTKNLSGGESFIVSLSLALGLSRMASRNVRVDSLFLDEGFGMLDDESLDTALSALSGLHQEGKLIGVISHVPALKERIGTQINIVPGRGGTSCIHGPGCKKL